MGMAHFILADEGDVYDINEYQMLARLIINKVDDFGTFLAQSVHEDIVLYIYIGFVCFILIYSMNAPLSLFCFCHVC